MQYSGDVRNAGRAEVQRPSGGGWRVSEDRGGAVRVVGQDLPLADLPGQSAGPGWNAAGRRRSSYRDGLRGGDGPVRQGEGWDLVTVGRDGGGAAGNNFVGGWIEDSANAVEGAGRRYERDGSVRSERETAAGMTRRATERDGIEVDVAGRRWKMNAEAIAAGTISRNQEGTGIKLPRGVLRNFRIFSNSLYSIPIRAEYL